MHVQDTLLTIKTTGYKRKRRPTTNQPGQIITHEGQDYINFSSNDYLGFSQDPAVQSAVIEALQQYGTGAGGSPLVTGYHPLHAALEQALCAFTGFGHVLLMTSGYLANLAILQCLSHRHRTLHLDKLAHASLIDGARLSGAKFKRFPHQSSPKAVHTNDVIAVEGVYSMDGHRAPLAALHACAAAQSAYLVLDDAHGFGLQGGHSWAQANCPAYDKLVYMGTLSKAMGALGGFVATNNTALFERLIQQARPYIYNTALPPHVAAGVIAALGMRRRNETYMARLESNIAHFRALSTPMRRLNSLTAIQGVICGDNARALAASQALKAHGFWVNAICPPTVPVGTARLRITLCANHTHAQIEGLIAALSESVPDL